MCDGPLAHQANQSEGATVTTPAIDKNVPIPAYRGHGKPGRWTVMASLMKPGDSVLVSTNGQRCKLMFALQRAYGVHHYTSRKVDCAGYRVWRTI